jgi:hypothetical protein
VRSELTAEEIELLVILLNDRIVDAEKNGVGRDHQSSKFREKLFYKLVCMASSTRRSPAKQAKPSPLLSPSEHASESCDTPPPCK